MGDDNSATGELKITFNVVKVLTYVIAFAVVGGIGGLGIRYVDPPGYSRWTKDDALAQQKLNKVEHEAIRKEQEHMKGDIAKMEGRLEQHLTEAEPWKRKIEIVYHWYQQEIYKHD